MLFFRKVPYVIKKQKCMYVCFPILHFGDNLFIRTFLLKSILSIPHPTFMVPCCFEISWDLQKLYHFYWDRWNFISTFWVKNSSGKFWSLMFYFALSSFLLYECCCFWYIIFHDERNVWNIFTVFVPFYYYYY